MAGRLIEEDLFTKYSILDNSSVEGQKIHNFLKARAEKRERNVAAILGETVGKGAAKERRAGVKIAWTDAVRKGTELVDAKVAAEARRTGGANLEANEELKKKLMHEMMVDAYVERINASASSKFK